MADTRFDPNVLTLERQGAGRDAFVQLIGDTLFYAFQPVIDLRDGSVFGFEALMRGYDQLGFPTPSALLDHGEQLGLADAIERLLRRKAIAEFAAQLGAAGGVDGGAGGARLFYNTRAARIDAHAAETLALLGAHGLSPARLCIEISETDPHFCADGSEALAEGAERALTALDDFGIGYSGLGRLLDIRPDIVKIDRAFVAGIDASPDRKAMVSHIVGLARDFGIRCLAEGIESERELRTCRELGCDMAQGYFIARPLPDIAAGLVSAARVAALIGEPPRGARRERDLPEWQNRIARAEIQHIAPISIDDTVQNALEAFRIADQLAYLPVVDAHGAPMGLILERRLRQYGYSAYGWQLLANRSRSVRVRDFVLDCPVFDILADLDEILGGAALGGGEAAVLIKEDGRYVGLLDAQAIMRTMHDRNLRAASDRNPLTQLDGNRQITDFVTRALRTAHHSHLLAYFDFDNFKPFNDMMGFRQGDRAILMFAELLRRYFPDKSALLGHIGGDDFFVGLRLDPGLPGIEAILARLQGLIADFAAEAASFYTEETRQSGLVRICDRDGVERDVRLLSVSCGCLSLRATERHGPRAVSMDEISVHLTQLKRAAKQSPQRFAAGTLDKIREAAPRAAANSGAGLAAVL